MNGLLKTKTFWSALAAIITGAGMCYTGEIGQGINAIVVGVLAITGRQAIAKIGQ